MTARARAAQAASEAPVHIPVHYDFASTLCYVTHRVMERIAHRLEPETETDPPVVFHWTPLDLAGLLNWNRGGVVPEDRRANVLRVAEELDVPVRVSPVWLDSRIANAAAIVLEERDESGQLEAAWRERTYTAIFEEGRPCGDPDEVKSWARDLGVSLADTEIEAGEEELERRTVEAAGAQVTGVPTFMLSHWPMGGIQDDDTMVSLIRRFAKRARERGTA